MRICYEYFMTNICWRYLKIFFEYLMTNICQSDGGGNSYSTFRHWDCRQRRSIIQKMAMIFTMMAMMMMMMNAYEWWLIVNSCLCLCLIICLCLCMVGACEDLWSPWRPGEQFQSVSEETPLWKLYKVTNPQRDAVKVG